MKARFTEFERGQNWVSGTVGKYNFEAKLFDVGSSYGINNGRVSKLSIWDDKLRQKLMNFVESCIVHYDRGWDIEPEPEHKEYYNAVMELLENAPKLF